MYEIQNFSFHTFWKKNDWPKVYAGSRLSTLLYSATHLAPKYLDNIVEIFLGNIIVRLLKYFKIYH